MTTKAYRPSSHERFTHDTLASLAFDWERVGNPEVAPRYPFKVYLPRTTADVVRAVQEVRERGEQLLVRGHGHSSNNLVTGEASSVLLTEWMDDVLDVDEAKLTCTMQAGAILAQVDTRLSEHGLGLSIIGDHDHITAAGFASVGGISPASHRYGMFVDTVVELEYVDWDGKVHRCTPTRKRDHFYRVLTGMGRHGVITSLKVAVIRADKWRTVLRNHRFMSLNVDEFVKRSAALIRHPGEAVMERGVWADFPVPGGFSVKLGQFSSYHETPQNMLKSLWNRAAYGYQHLLGYWGGRLPTQIDVAAKYMGMAAIMLSPQYAAVKNVERFTDQVLDSTVGDPTRMLIVLAPAERYEVLFHQLYDLCVKERRRSGAISSISLYVKAIRSPYLSRGDTAKRHCELMLFLGCNPERMTEAVLGRLVAAIDDLTIANDAFRYMHTRTSTDPIRRQLIDPNAAYADLGEITSEGVRAEPTALAARAKK
jgi:hypothetical protein